MNLNNIDINEVVRLVKMQNHTLIKVNFIVCDFLSTHDEFIKYKGRTLRENTESGVVFYMGEIENIKITLDPNLSVFQSNIYSIDNKLLIEFL